jgi:hypothetical protein
MASASELLLEPAASLPRRDSRSVRTTAREPGRSTTFHLLLTFALYVIPLLVTLRPVGTPVCDPDLWWHLQVGRWVVEHRAVPATDPFSAYGEGRTWLAYSWLFEVLLFGLYSAFGLTGVVSYRAAMSVAITAALHRLILRKRPPELLGAGLTAVCLLPLAMLFSERPWLFTILFGTISLTVVLNLRDGRKSWSYWLLPVMFAVWANVHIQFVYGLALLGLACVAPAIDRRFHTGDDGTIAGLGSPAWRRVAALTIACTLATLVNPYGARLYAVILEYATQPGPYQFVNELKALDFREPSDWAMLGLAGAATFALGRRRRLGSFEVLLLCGSACLSFRSRRDLWLVDVAAASILSAGPFKSAAPVDNNATTGHRLSFASAMLALIAALAVARNLWPSRLQETAETVFPARAARFVAEQGYEGPLFNDFNWGGYLIFALPNLPVAVDGRTNLHGDERLLRIGGVWAGAAGWRDDPDLSAARVVIANTQQPLATLLQLDERFEVAYDDDIARVFVKRKQHTH